MGGLDLELSFFRGTGISIIDKFAPLDTQNVSSAGLMQNPECLKNVQPGEPDLFFSF